MDITRRHLLLLTPAAAAFLSRLGGAEPAAPENKYDMAQHYWGMLIDIEKCIGCGNCVRACETENGVPAGYFRTWVERYSVTGWEEDHPEVDSPNGGHDGFPDKPRPAAKNFFVPKLCNHCAHSPCVQVCPVGATFESPDGLVLVDKCTLCYHRISQGETTACSETCPTQARRLVDLKNPKDPVHEFLRNNSVQVLKPHMATGSKVFYRALDMAVR